MLHDQAGASGSPSSGRPRCRPSGLCPPSTAPALQRPLLRHLPSTPLAGPVSDGSFESPPKCPTCADTLKVGRWAPLAPRRQARPRQRNAQSPGGRQMVLTARQEEAVACSSTARSPACRHFPQCPGATAPDRDAACTVAAHPEQGWSLLCNGIVFFDDTGELLPDRCAVAPRRASPGRRGGVPVVTRQQPVISPLRL